MNHAANAGSDKRNRRGGRLTGLVAALSMVAAGMLGSAGATPLPAAARVQAPSSSTAAPASHRANDATDAVASGSRAPAQSVGSARNSFPHMAVAAAPTPDGQGFWVAWADGSVTTYGNATWYGDMSGHALNAAIVGIAPTANGGGYWLLGSDGGVFSFGDAGFYGSTGALHLNAPALQMISTADSRGYDFVAADGGVFSFGDAAFHGSTGGMQLNQPVVGIARTPSGGGYWLVARDGGIFTFGAASFYGSTGAITLNAPITSVAATANGGGYWLLGADGGIFAFGDAGFHGSAAGSTNGAAAIGLVDTGDGGGYWIVLSSGQVLNFGDAAAVRAPAGSAAAGPPATGPYTFEITNGAGTPVRWNPCDVIHYSVAYLGAPAGWQSDVANAMSQVSAATGMSFVEDGAYLTTLQIPSSTKLTISWVPSLVGGDTVGLATYWYILDPRYTPQFTAGQIQLLTSLIGGGGPNGELPVLLHELGHTVGLGHTPNAPEVMNPIDQGFMNYQSGDLNGLWALGAKGGCSGFYQ
ncbi:MAG: hypothetical protein ACYC1D_00180 [Acidimicrobiales bacterium]